MKRFAFVLVLVILAAMAWAQDYDNNKTWLAMSPKEKVDMAVGFRLGLMATEFVLSAKEGREVDAASLFLEEFSAATLVLRMDKMAAEKRISESDPFKSFSYAMLVCWMEGWGD